MPSLDAVITAAAAIDNDVTIPAANPVIFRDGGVALVPFTVIQTGGGVAAILVDNPGSPDEVRITPFGIGYGPAGAGSDFEINGDAGPAAAAARDFNIAGGFGGVAAGGAPGGGGSELLWRAGGGGPGTAVVGELGGVGGDVTLRAGIPGTDGGAGPGTGGDAFFGTLVPVTGTAGGVEIRAGGVAFGAPAAGQVSLAANAVAAAGDEVLFNFAAVVNKAAGNYTGGVLNVVETAAPGVNNRLFDLQASGITQMHVTTLGAVLAGGPGGGSQALPALGFELTAGLGFFDNGGTIRVSLGGAGRYQFSTTYFGGLINNTYDLGHDTLRWKVANIGPGTVALPSVSVAEADVGLFQPATKQLGLGAFSEAVIVDNDAAIPSFRPDVHVTWNLGESSFYWLNIYGGTLISGAGSVASPGVNVVGASGVGLYRPAANQLGLAANNEAVIVDNDAATPSFRPDVDNTWNLGEATFRWALVYSGRYPGGSGAVGTPTHTFAGGLGVGTFLPAGNQLGLAANSEAVIIDNDAATPSLRPDVTNTWDFGEAAIEWKDGYFAGDINIGADLNHDGLLAGFYAVAPTAQSAAYTITNVTPDRTYDADAMTLDEIADVLGTVIADLQLTGLLG